MTKDILPTDILPAKGWRRLLPKFLRRKGPKPGLVTVVKLSGVIASGGGIGPKLNLDAVNEQLEAAFKPKKLSAVALLINSPGGSPVQSSLIGGRIRELAAEKNVPVLAFVEDVAASGGYWLACAADEIFLDDASIIGSIGVISASFGFQDAIEKLGVERRLYTAGDNKSRLDSFSPAKKKDIDWLKDLQLQIHGVFKTWVKSRRGEKLQADDATLMNGDVWIGQAAVDNGLADGLGQMHATLKKRFGEKVTIKVTEKKTGLMGKLGLRSEAPGLIDGLGAELDLRALRSRFGL